MSISSLVKHGDRVFSFILFWLMVKTLAFIHWMWKIVFIFFSINVILILRFLIVWVVLNLLSSIVWLIIGIRHRINFLGYVYVDKPISCRNHNVSA